MPIPPRPSGLIELPLTQLQKRWWFLCNAYPGGSSPLVSVVHRLRGPLNVDAWQRAVQIIADRHEVLRTLFVSGDGDAHQVVGDVELKTEVVDVPDEATARRLLEERRQAWLDLEKGPLAQSTLMRLSDEDHIWVLTIHHILSDGYSLAVIDRELSLLYPELDRAGLPELTIQYGDYALWRSTSDTEKEDEDREYWQEQLAGAPALELRDQLPRPAAKGAPAAEVALQLDGELVGALERLARDTRSSRFIVMLAALNQALVRASGLHDFCVGVPVAGADRVRPELARLVGLFNNALALRCRIPRDASYLDFLEQARDTVLDAMDFQDLPWGEVVKAVGAPQDPGRAQVFQVMFLHDDVAAASRLPLPGLEVDEFPLAIPKILHDLMVYARPNATGMELRFVYDTGLFRPETIAQLLDDYAGLLRKACLSTLPSAVSGSD